MLSWNEAEHRDSKPPRRAARYGVSRGLAILELSLRRLIVVLMFSLPSIVRRLVVRVMTSLCIIRADTIAEIKRLKMVNAMYKANISYHHAVVEAAKAIELQQREYPKAQDLTLPPPKRLIEDLCAAVRALAVQTYTAECSTTRDAS